jgi:uncharacterized protein
LAIPALRDAGRLTQFPSSNTVLSSRSGYREFFRSYLLADIAASLDFDGGDDVFSAGQRNVAALYEYWAFLELARIVEDLGFDVDRKSLLRVTNNRLSLDLLPGQDQRAPGKRCSTGPSRPTRAVVQPHVQRARVGPSPCVPTALC